MAKIPCEIIRDLLPLYQDDICSEKSRNAIEEHIKELFKVYGLDKVNIDKMNFTIDMWKRLEKEYIFLKKKAEKPQAVYGTQQNGNNLQYISEISELTKQRDYLQYVIDETRKSKTYKIGRVITAIPRKIREKI